MKSKPTIPKRSLALAAMCAVLAPGAIPAGAQSSHGCESQVLPAAYFQAAPGPHDSSGGFEVPSQPVRPVLVSTPNATLHLYVAADNPSRDLGLMCIVAMKPHAGMLFAFAFDGPQPFWMKNTLIPLDMVFVRGDGVVSSVAADVPQSKADAPEDQVARRTGNGRYVIELNAGEAAADGIHPGVVLRLPAVAAQ